MKKSLKLFASAAAVLLAAGCLGDLQYEDPSNEVVTHRFRLSLDVETKTELVGTGKSRQVVWNDGDQLYYFTKIKDVSQAGVYLQDGIAYVDISLKGNKDYYINAFYSGEANDPDNTDFPVEIVEQSTNNSPFWVSGVANSRQNYRTFAEAHACAASLYPIYEGAYLNFKSVVSIFKFNVDNATIGTGTLKKVVFSTPTANQTINGGPYGELSITMEHDDDGVGHLKSVQSRSDFSEGYDAITVMTNGATGDFYFSVIPSYFADGFVLKCYDGNTLLKEVAYERSLVAGKNQDGSLHPSVIDLGKVSQWVNVGYVQPVNPVTSLTLSPSSLSFELGDAAKTFTATVNNQADDKAVTWSNSNAAVADVALVSFSGNVTTLRVTPKAVGTSTITVTTSGKDQAGNPIVKTCTVTVTEPAPVLPDDLSEDETANCYIAPALDTDYRFRANVKGNSSVSIAPHHAAVIWEQRNKTGNNDNSAISTGDVVSDVVYNDGYVTFHTVSAGNALIAVQDANSKNLWSWHIWVWPNYDESSNSQVYKNGAGTMMDRNLGATMAFPPTRYDKRAYGLMYQWGRKDPFFGLELSRYALGPGISQVPEPVTSSATTGTVDYTVENPFTYILYAANNASDWHFGSRNHDLWGGVSGSKSPYDPCPPGWKVPGDLFWYTCIGPSPSYSYSSLNDAYPGLDFKDIMATGYSHVFYPVQGCYSGVLAESPHDPENGVSGETYYGTYWTSGGDSVYGGAYCLSINRTAKTVAPRTKGSRSSAFSVRCMKDGSSSSGGSSQGGGEQGGEQGGGTTDPDPVTVYVTKVTVSPTSQSVYENHTFQLTYKVEPSNADNKSVIWSSSDETSVTVDENGLVTAIKKKGSTPVTITATPADNGGGTPGTCQITVDEFNSSNLSNTSNGTANCYIVTEPGNYCFKAVRGNSKLDSDAITPASAIRLWQSYGTSTSVTSPVITNVDVASDMIFFTVPDPMKEGNAVIAALNGLNGIIWSWHIWVTRENPETKAQTYVERTSTTNANGETVVTLTGKTVAVVMDRNLGALSATPGTVGSLGLMYQWGRKDPFLASDRIVNASYNSKQPVAASESSYSWSTVAGPKTVDDAIASPMTFITASKSWYSGSDLLWSDSSKTIYDPCPPGWMVPAGGKTGLWARSTGVLVSPESTYDSTNYGAYYYNLTATGSVWLPLAGYRSESSGDIIGAGGSGVLWSGTLNGSSGYALNQGTGNSFNLQASYARARACTLRCVKE